MATLLEISNMGNINTKLKLKFQGGLIKVSWAAFTELESVENHANRLAFSKKVLLDPEEMNRKYWLFLLSNSTIQTKMDDSTEDDIEYVCTDLYNAIANAEETL